MRTADSALALQQAWEDPARTRRRRDRITFAQFANSFIPFALAVLIALWAAELTPLNGDRARTLYTIRAAIVLLTLALCLFLFRDYSPAADNYWLLFWTFSYLAFLVHFYWAVAIIYDGDISRIFRVMGNVIAGSNFLLAAWWGLDVLLSWIAWIVRRDPKWLRIERMGAHLFALAVFAYTAIELKPGVFRIEGIVMCVAIGFCVIARLIDCRQRLSHSNKRESELS